MTKVTLEYVEVEEIHKVNDIRFLLWTKFHKIKLMLLFLSSFEATNKIF